MTKRGFVVLFLLFLFLLLVYQNIYSKVLWKQEELDTMRNQENDKSLKRNIFSLKGINCRRLLLTYRSTSLNEELLKWLNKICFEQIKLQTQPTFDTKVLEEAFGNMNCPETKPVLLNESGPLVALASYPGSGNTWTRLILENITGVYTGSVYDEEHFPGTHQCPSKAGVLIVKTHQKSTFSSHVRCPKDIKFSRAIFILRNPYDTLMAEYNRRMGPRKHKVRYGERKTFFEGRWRLFVENSSREWKGMALYWLTEADIPVHVLVYEDLKANIMLETYKMMNFLNLNVTLQNLYCLFKKPLDEYYRDNKPSWLKKTNLFNDTMRECINSYIKSVYLKVVNTLRRADILKSYILSDAK